MLHNLIAVLPMFAYFTVSGAVVLGLGVWAANLMEGTTDDE